jgi:hypothetical protein
MAREAELLADPFTGRERSLSSEMRELWRRGVAVLPRLTRLLNRSLNTDVEAPPRNSVISYPADPPEELRNMALPTIRTSSQQSGNEIH